MHTIEFCRTIKKTEIPTFAGKWIGLKIIMLNETNQTQEACFLSYEKPEFKFVMCEHVYAP